MASECELGPADWAVQVSSGAARIGLPCDMSPVCALGAADGPVQESSPYPGPS